MLFALSYDYVGDLSETVALIWPGKTDAEHYPSNHPPLSLPEVVETPARRASSNCPRRIAGWLDALDETGRWALLKLITGGIARRRFRAAGEDRPWRRWATCAPDDVEEVWHGLTPPYLDLFAWLEGRGPRPEAVDPAPFRPVMLAQAIDEADLRRLIRPRLSPPNGNGTACACRRCGAPDGGTTARLYSRTGEDISAAFPDIVEMLAGHSRAVLSIDGELLIRARRPAAELFGVCSSG